MKRVGVDGKGTKLQCRSGLLLSRLIRNTITSMMAILRAGEPGQAQRYPSKHELDLMAQRIIECYPMLQDKNAPVKHVSDYFFFFSLTFNHLNPYRVGSPSGPHTSVFYVPSLWGKLLQKIARQQGPQKDAGVHVVKCVCLCFFTVFF